MRVTVLLPRCDVGAILALMSKRRASGSTIVSQAIGTEKFLDDVHRDGGNVFVFDKRGNGLRMVPR